MGNSFSAALLMMVSTTCMAFDSDTEAYQECVLAYQKGAKTELSAQLIEQSCNQIHLNGTYLLSAEKKYHRCIVEKMPGVETDAATLKVRSICSDLSTK